MQGKGLVCIAGLSAALSFNAMAIEVGSFSTERFDTSWTLNGGNMVDARAKLLNPNNFGPQGTVPEAVNITDVSSEITYTVLSPFNVFFAGYLSDSADQPITEDEGQAFFDWVNAGGTLIITCDDNNHDSMCIAFNLQESEDSAVEPVEPTVAGTNRPLFDGPFGAPTSLDMSGNQPYFTGIGGFSVLAEDQNGDPVVLESIFGDGRVVAFTDVDMVSDTTLSDGSGILNDNDQFWGNLIAYLNDESDETFFANAGLNGFWWGGPSRNGEGVQLEIANNGVTDVVILTFYSYDSEGNQIFLIAVGNIDTDSNTTELDVFITEGGMWGPDFDPADVTEDQVGTAVLTVYHCGLINIAFNPNAEYEALGYADLQYDFTRLVTPIAPCPVAFPPPLLVQ